jgi:hypothetical protein
MLIQSSGKQIASPLQFFFSGISRQLNYQAFPDLLPGRNIPAWQEHS